MLREDLKNILSAFDVSYNSMIMVGRGCDNILIDGNTGYHIVNDGIMVDRSEARITNNVIAFIFFRMFYQNQYLVALLGNAQPFAGNLPSCINTNEAQGAIVTGNRCAGGDGPGFQGKTLNPGLNIHGF